MANIDILRDPFFKLPAQRSDKYFIDFVEQSLTQYLEFFKELDGEVRSEILEFSESSSNLCQGIINSVKEYYNGLPAKAFETFSNALDPFIDRLIPINSFGIISSYEKVSLYRARVENDRFLTKKDLFHVPFEERYKIGSQRFSIPGLPCLYFSNSSYLCWEELNRPDINNLQVSRFELNLNKTRLLDLSLIPEFSVCLYDVFSKKHDNVTQLNPDNYSLIKESFLLWPLTFACSIIVQNHKNTFKPEYIIPQLLLQFINTNSKLDGIKYISTKKLSIVTKAGKLDASSFTNYVVPVKNINSIGHCTDLLKAMKLTEPISIKSLDLINFENAEDDYKKLFDPGDGQSTERIILFNLSFNTGLSQPYIKTKFGKLEIALSNLNADYLENC